MSHYPQQNSWQSCQFCGRHVHRLQWGSEWRCPYCQRYQRLTIDQRLALTVDQDSWEPLPMAKQAELPTNFPGYQEKVSRAQKQTGHGEAVQAGQATIGEHAVVLAIMDAHFMMGTLNSQVTEQLLSAFQLATSVQLPLVIFTASGGARMQEGLYSLFGMNRLLHAVHQLAEARIPLINILTDPTMGGVSASFAFEADIVLAEQQAQIGFAGKRVIEQTSLTKLTPDFQSAAKLAEYGQIDQVLARHEIRPALIKLLALLPTKGGL